MKKFKNIYIEITNECNLKCNYCPSSHLNLHQYLSIDNFKIIIDKIKDYTDGIYLHILGEPLLNKDIFKMISYANSFLKVSLTTNGTLIKNYLNELIAANLYIINISLQNLYQFSYEKIDEYFLHLNELIIKRKDQTAIHLRLWNDKSDNDINKFNDYILKKIEEYHLLDYKNVNLSLDNKFIWPDKIKEEGFGHCLGGKSQLAIHVDGNISLCCLDYSKKAIIGNIYDDDLNALLNNNLYQDIILGWQNNKPYFDVCKACSFKNRFRS